MTRHEYLHDYFYKLIGIHMSEKEISEIIDIAHKNDTCEDNVPTQYLDDCIIIRDILREAGYDIGLSNAMSLWSDWSKRVACGWATLYFTKNGNIDKESIINCLNRWGNLDKNYFKL